jgi:hypothetical protein
MQKIIYYRAIEIGRDSMPDGISYNDLVKRLKSEGHLINESFNDYFISWFFSQFYELSEWGTLSNPSHLRPRLYVNLLIEKPDLLDLKCIITGSALRDLTSHDGLRHTKILSIIAVIVSLASLVIPSLISLKAPPPNQSLSKRIEQIYTLELEILKSSNEIFERQFKQQQTLKLNTNRLLQLLDSLNKNQLTVPSLKKNKK